MQICNGLGRLAAGLIACALAACATMPADRPCRWRLQIEPRVIAGWSFAGDVRPVAQLTARPVCVPTTPRVEAPRP